MLRDIFIIATLMLMLDTGWLNLIKGPFLNMISKIQKQKINIKFLPLVLCYIILISAHYYFIIHRKACLLDSFMLGFFIYATYELTNYTVFNSWNPYIAFADTLWGGFLFLLTYIIYIYINKYV